MAKTHKAMALDYLAKLLADPGTKTPIKLKCAELILRSAHGWTALAAASKLKATEAPKEPKKTEPEKEFQNEAALDSVLRKLDSQ